jgi:hypothetical protein
MFEKLKTTFTAMKPCQLTLESYEWGTIYMILDRITPELADEIELWAYGSNAAKAKGILAPDIAQYMLINRRYIIANLKTLRMQNLSFRYMGWMHVTVALFHMLTVVLPQRLAVCVKCQDDKRVAYIEREIESGRKIYPRLLAFVNQHTPSGSVGISQMVLP